MFGLEEALSTLSTLYVKDVAISEHVLLAVRSALYKEESSQIIISTINKYLSVAKTRDKGFEILYRLLLDCTKKVLDDNAIIWVNFAVSLHPNEPVPPRRLQVIGILITSCHTTQDFHKAIVNNLLGKIIDTCVSVHPRQSESLASLDCLNKCMQHFSSTCVAFKTKLHNYLIKFIDLPLSDGVLGNAATCYHYINQIGGAGVGGSLHIKNYSDGQEKLCNTLDWLYDKLFENIDEYHETKCDKSNIVEFAQVPSVCTRSDYLKILGRRLRNVTGFIAKSLECGYPVRKCIKPELLLQVIQRGLDTHIHAGEKDMENVFLSVTIQKHQIDLLLLLKSLINCLGPNIIRFTPIKLLLEYLARTKNCNCFEWNSEYKVVIYEVLEHWILNSGEYLDSATYDKIMRHIIEDITPIKTSLTLNIKPSQKNKQNDVKSVKNPTEHTTFRKTEHLEAICYQALVTLKTLLKKILLTIKDTTCTLLHETVTKNLLNISVGIHETPYTNKNCRKTLYETLISIYDQNYRNMDMGLAINVLNIGVHIADMEISNVCCYGLSSLEKLCQPIHYSLDIPASKKDELINGDDSEVSVNSPTTMFETTDVVDAIEEKVTEISDDNEKINIEEIIDISEDEGSASKRRRSSDDVLFVNDDDDDEFTPAEKKLKVLQTIVITNVQDDENLSTDETININATKKSDDINVTKKIVDVNVTKIDSEDKVDSSTMDEVDQNDGSKIEDENDDMLSSFIDEVAA